MNTKNIVKVVAIMIIFFALVMFPSVSSAQDPQPEDGNEPLTLAPEDPSGLVSSSFTYQGQLRKTGTVVNGYCDFIWKIYASDVGGTALATDSDTNVQVTNGLFTAVINASSGVFDSNARFLEVQVRCPTGEGDYAPLTPRQELQAVPYALGLHLPLNHTTANVGTVIFSISNTSSATTFPTIQGSSAGSDGVRGLSTGASSADNGVYGETNSTSSSEAGVKGASTSTASFGGYFSNPSATSGGALYANGDAKQLLSGNGFVKAGVYVTCSNTSSTIIRSFNNVNTTLISVSNGISVGWCTVDFGFNVSSRFVTAMSINNGARIVTFQTGSASDQLDFYRYDLNGNGQNGDIMILIY